MNNTYNKIIENQLKKEIEMFGQLMGITTNTNVYPTKLIKGIVKFKQNLIQSSDYIITIQDKLLFITLESVNINDYIYYNKNIYKVTSIDNTIPNIYKIYSTVHSTQNKYTLLVEGNKYLNLYTNESYQIMCTCKENEAVVENPTITYKSSDTSILTISDTGLATVIGDPLTSCKITISWNGITEEKYIEVLENVYKITLDEVGIMSVNDVEQLTYTCTCNNQVVENPIVTFISSNEDIARIDENGLLTGISEGDLVITANYENVTASISVYVEENITASYTVVANDETIKDEEGSYEISKYDTETFTVINAIGVADDGTWDISVDYNGNDIDVATVMNKGNNYIKIKNNGYMGLDLKLIFSKNDTIIEVNIKLIR